MNTIPCPFLLIEPEDLAKKLPSKELIIVAVCSEKVFSEGHLPGAILVQPGELVCGVKPATGKLPSQESLDRLFSRIGLSHDKHLIAYDDEAVSYTHLTLPTILRV